MKNYRHFGNVIFFTILSLIVLTQAYVLIVGANTPDNQLIQHDALQIEHGWYYYDQNLARHYIPHLPAMVPTVDSTAVIFIDTKNTPRFAPGDEFDRFICFYAQHQDIVVRVDGRPIYYSATHPHPSWISSYRGMYHLVALPPDFLFSRTISIEATAHTKRGLGRFSIVLIGERSHLLQTILKQRYVQGLLGLGLLISTLFLFGTSYVFHSFVSKDYSMLFLAMVALSAGLWQLENSRILQFFTGYQPLHWGLEYLLPPVIPIFTYLFLRHIDRTPKNIALGILGTCTIIVPLVQLALQVAGIVMLSDSMFLTHTLFVYDCVYVIYYLNRQRHSPLHMTLIVCFSCSLAIFIFMFVSLLVFGIFFDGVMSAGLLLTFVTMTLMTHSRVLLRAQEASKNAVYKELAFTDIATGVLNKTAWYTLIDNYKAEKNPSDKQASVEYTLVLFDMNNLKKTNDTYGHLAGDQMIKAFATAVKSAFEGVGDIYRIGGDEFIAVCKGAARETVDSALRVFDEAVATQPPSEHPFSAAYGITVFIPTSRMDFENAITAADTQMYENKVAMKATRED